MKKSKDEVYVSKAQLIKQGYVHRSEGGYKRLTVLEKYAKRGWLDFGSKAFTAEDRVQTGLRFYADFYYSRLTGEGVIDLSKIKVDGGHMHNLPENVLCARNRFFKAFRAITSNYLPIVAKVCIEDREIGIARHSQDYRHELELSKEYLCLGIDELIYHYNGKPKFVHHKPKSLSSVDFWEGFSDYCLKVGL